MTAIGAQGNQRPDGGKILRHWNHVAVRWKHFACPLRPCSQDTSMMIWAVCAWCKNHSARNPSVLLCGVTPELATMPWPEGTDLLAVERSTMMIEHVWPGDNDWRKIQQGEWCDEAFANASRDIVIGDGCFISMPYPDGYLDLAKKLRNVITSDGLFVMRFFVPPDPSETPEQVFGDLAEGRIGSFHVFKWRLAMSLQETSRTGVVLNDIWSTWADQHISLSTLANKPGWTPDEVSTIELYKDRPVRFAFAQLAEVREILSDLFVEVSADYGTYELAERCPILVMRPR